MPHKCYAGIGSRATSRAICDTMSQIARKLAYRNFTLRSGGAGSADYAFESGLNDEPYQWKEIFIPWEGFRSALNNEGRPRYSSQHGVVVPSKRQFERGLDIAAETWDGRTPWVKLKRTTKLLFARNVFQVLGLHEDDIPSCFVLYHIAPTAKTSGTSFALQVAERFHVPHFQIEPKHSDHDVVDWAESATAASMLGEGIECGSILKASETIFELLRNAKHHINRPQDWTPDAIAICDGKEVPSDYPVIHKISSWGAIYKTAHETATFRGVHDVEKGERYAKAMIYALESTGGRESITRFEQTNSHAKVKDLWNRAMKRWRGFIERGW